MKKKNNVLYIGNAFIALSFFGFVFIYFPVIRGYFFPPEIAIPVDQPIISIPTINAVAPIIFNIDPWHKEEYLDALKKGVAHAEGTALPGENGTVYLFAHSSDAPWRLTRYNTIFLRLNQLAIDDKITITSENKTFHYRVREKKTIWPNETEYLTDVSKNQLILQTCWPIGTDLKRLLIFADPL